jgi:hypothetical protein
LSAAINNKSSSWQRNEFTFYFTRGASFSERAVAAAATAMTRHDETEYVALKTGCPTGSVGKCKMATSR